MNKIFYLFIILTVTISCSFNKNSKFWTETKQIKIEKNYIEVLKNQEKLTKEFNSNLIIRLDSNIDRNLNLLKQYNNDGRFKFDGNLKKISRYNFSKIKNFHHYEPEISFHNNNLIFFNNKGTILKFSESSKLIWKKNYYSKSERKFNPILQFANNNKYLVVADNIAKYYLINIENGNLIWMRNNLAPFNSQIKIYKDKFFTIDFSNTIRCFSLQNGKELWNVKTENSLVRSQKKLSIVIVKNKLYFNNSIGDVTAVDINKGEMIWQLPTQSSNINETAFSLKTSDIVADDKNLYFSNNKNQFFSIDIDTGSFEWKNNINSIVRPVIVDNLIFTVSLEGYLIVIEKNTGNIIRISDIFNSFKLKKRAKIKPSGFLIGINKLYLTTSNGRLIVIDINSGKTRSIMKIDNEKISRPFVNQNNLFVIKDNSVIKLN